jgi:hypothetical protein
MAKDPPRLIFTVTPHDGGWAVEHDGQFMDQAPTKDEVMASASRRARAVSGQGSLTQVVVRGESGFFPASR